MHSVTGNQINHFIVEKPDSLISFLEGTLSIDADKIQDLLSLGSIFLNKKRIAPESAIELKKDDYLRVHLNPKRYATHSVNWTERLIFQNEDFLILDKPNGIPVHATVDNATENVAVALAKFLGFELHVTHRLDIPVSGLMLLAKNKKFQSRFNKYLLKRRIQKKYRALVKKCPLVGPYLHHMQESPWYPKVLQETATPNTLECSLEIIGVKAWNDFHQLEIQLHTGRTHQIRAQLAFIGSSILGDHLYGGPLSLHSDYNENRIALSASHLSFENHSFALPELWPKI